MIPNLNVARTCGARILAESTGVPDEKGGRRMVEHKVRNGYLPCVETCEHTTGNLPKVSVEMMKLNALGNRQRMAVVLCLAAMLATSAVTAIKNMALVVSAGSKLADVPLADLSKLCKGVQKAWPDGKNFTLIIKDPESAEMHVTVQKLFGAAPGEVKAAIAKLNEARPVVKIVESDEDLLRAVAATPGAVGILDVYSINSSVKVLRVDGKLPFDMGYALKGN